MPERLPPGIRPKNNGFEVRVYAGFDPLTGKQRQISRMAKTITEAKKLKRELEQQVAEAGRKPPTKATVAEFIREWLSWAKANVRPGTYRRYEELSTRYIAPELAEEYGHVRRLPEGVTGIGHHRLDRLTTEAIDQFLSGLVGLMSDSNRHHVFRTLRRALNVAKKWRRIPNNPCEGVDPPRVAQKPMHCPSVAEVNALLQAAEGDRLYPLLLMSSHIGLRQGEALALRWSDLDRQAGTLTIGRSLARAGDSPEWSPTKSAKVRVVALPPEVLTALDKLKVSQELERAFFGSDPETGYQDHGLIFCLENGRPYGPRTLVRRFKALLKKAGLPQEIRWHDLRHGAATHLLRAGNDPNTVAAILGHHSGAFTVAKYGHALGSPKQAMDRLSAYYAASMKAREEPEA